MTRKKLTIFALCAAAIFGIFLIAKAAPDFSSGATFPGGIWNSSGGVGVGTTNPTAQMSGTYGIGIYKSTYPAIGFKNDTTSWLWYGEGGMFKMWNVSAGDMLTAKTNGYIGIGTTNPVNKLDVVGNINASGQVISAGSYSILPSYSTVDASSLDSGTWYPVTFGATDLQLDCEIHSPNLGGASAYNQNMIRFLLTAQGWSDTPKRFELLSYGVYDTSEITIGAVAYGTQNGEKAVYVRGGMVYRFKCNAAPTLRSSNYTYGNEIYTPTTNLSSLGTNVTKAWVYTDTPPGTASPASGISKFANVYAGTILSSGGIGIGTNSPGAGLDVQSAVGGYTILAGNNKIGNVAAPTLNSDAATKGYVDSAVTTGVSSVAWSAITGRPDWLAGGSYIASSPSDLNTWMDSGFYQNYNGTNNPVGTWFNFINVRHSNQGNYHGFQLGMSYYDNNLWWRSYQGSGTFQNWVHAISNAGGAIDGGLTVAGSMGVGVTSPAAPLNVYNSGGNNNGTPLVRFSKGGSPVSNIAYDTMVLEANDVPTIRLMDADGTTATITSGDTYTTISSTHPIRFFTSATSTGLGYSGMGGTQRMIIDNSGNVGIGTNPANGKLDVNGSITADSNGTYGDLQMYRSGANLAGNWSPSAMWGLGWGDSNRNVYLKGTDGGIANLMMNGGITRSAHAAGYQIGSYNSVGGNSTYTNPIYVIGSNYEPSDSSLGNMYGIGYSHSNFWGGGKSTGWGLYTAENGVVHNTISDGGIWTAGKLGVNGTASSTYALEVNGDVRANGWLRTYGSVGWYNETYGGGWYMSDSTWLRTYNNSYVWTGNGLLGSNGGLTVGYGGATPPSAGAIISGNVGIGLSNPSEKLTVSGTIYSSINTTDAAIYGNNSTSGVGTYGVLGVASSGGVLLPSAQGIGVYGYGNTGVYGRSSTGYNASYSLDGVGVGGTSSYIGVRGANTVAGGYAFYAVVASGSTKYGPFTGGHDAILSSDSSSVKSGMIMSATGEDRKHYDDKNLVVLSDTLPTVQLSSKSNDSSIFGVFVGESVLEKEAWYYKDVKPGERRIIVNAVGEGRILVTNINGDIKNGDYITSSDVPGYGMKQSDDLVHNYTVGKATENVDWDKVTETVNWNGRELKVYLIGAVYTSG